MTSRLSKEEVEKIAADSIVTRENIEAIAKPWCPPMLYPKDTPAVTKFVGYEGIEATLLSPVGAQAYLDFIDAAYQTMVATWNKAPLKVAFEEQERVVKEILKRREATVPAECLNLTFALTGVSRQATHQIVRHRAAGFGQESLRICDNRMADVRMPPAIDKAKEAVRSRYINIITRAKEFYADMIDAGIPIEQARNILPIGTITYITETGNLRAWLQIWNDRWRAGAQDEHRVITAVEIKELKTIQPQLYEFLKDAGVLPQVEI